MAVRRTFKNFTAGELSPDMYARYDVDKYGTGCMKLRNFLLLPQGGCFKRPGMKYTATGGVYLKKIRLIPFEFGVVQAYALEFGDQYMRVYRNGGQVLEANKTITGATQANPCVITSVAHGYSSGQEVYIASVGGMTTLNGRNFRIVVLSPDTFSLKYLDGSVVNSAAFGAYTSGGTVARVYEIVLPFTETDLFDLYYSQTADVMTLTHPSYAPRELTRTGHTSWTITTIAFAPSIAAPASPSATPSAAGATTYSYKVTAVTEADEESLPTAAFTTTNDLGTAGHYNDIAYSAVAGAIKYNVYKLKGGVHGYIGSADALTFRDDNIAPVVNDTPPNARNPFNAVGDYPSVVGFQKQRRVFAATNNKPDTIFMSIAGQYKNMSVSIPTKADDAITFAIASGQVNKINHLVGFRDLLAMTVGNEWKIGSSSGALSPTTIAADPETNYGSTTIKPILIGNTAIFAAKYGRSVRDYVFDYAVDGYDGNDLSVLSKHLLKDASIVDWSFAQEPDRVIWAQMSDGKMLGLTYMREHKIYGWGRHDTDGIVESSCTVPDPINRLDATYFVVRRTINGQQVRMIERLEKYVDTPIESAYFLDCGLSYSGSPISTVSGLWHLEGRSVSIFADGNVLAPITVVNGQITMPQAASVIHVGLPYSSELQPMTPESDGDQVFGSTKALSKVIRNIKAEVYRTRGLRAGQSADDPIISTQKPSFTNGFDMSTTIQPYTGMILFGVQSAWKDDYVAPYLLHDTPTPCKIFSVTPTYG